MANFKIFNIGKANTRIDELEAENKTLKAQLEEVASSVPEALVQAEKANADLLAKNSQTEADLATAKKSIVSLTVELDSANFKIADFTAKLEAKGKEVAQQVAIRTAETLAAVGAPPAPSIPQSAKEPSKLTGMDAVRAGALAALKAAGVVTN